MPEYRREVLTEDEQLKEFIDKDYNMTEYRDLEKGDILEDGDQYKFPTGVLGLKTEWTDLNSDFGRSVSVMKREISFRRPIEEPSPLLDSAESVGEGVCDHKTGLSRCMEYGVEVVTIAFLSDDENDEVDRFTFCPDCGAKLEQVE